MSDLKIEQEEKGHRGAFFINQDGKRVGEMTFSRVNPSLVMIDHTDVDDSLRGQGAGRKMLDGLIAWARAGNTKVIPVCPFAKAQFDKDPSIGDVLSK